MEFGRVEPNELNSIDHSLPKDSAKTKAILKAAKSKTKGTVHFGCAKWGRKEWINLIYPKGTKEKDFLKEYGKHFNCIELNATFYQIYPVAKIEAWAKDVGGDFLFCPKFNQSITHFRRLKKCDDITSSFLESISGFGKKRGPCFLQLPDNFAPKNFEILQAYLLALPKDLEVFVEVRHTDWFTTDYRDKLFDFLASNSNGWVTTDTSGRRDCVHTELPIPKAFIRFVGNNLHPTDYPRIDAWVDKINAWLKAGVKDIYFMMHQHDESNTPIISEYTVKQLNEKCGIDLIVPLLLNSEDTPKKGQKSLF
jgi:uncharacterized protein YecE (DUF72 family)